MLYSRHKQRRSSPPSSRAPQPVALVVSTTVGSRLWINPDRHEIVNIVATMPIGQVVFQFDPDKLGTGREDIAHAIELEKHISRRKFRVVEDPGAPELTVFRDA